MSIRASIQRCRKDCECEACKTEYIKCFHAVVLERRASMVREKIRDEGRGGDGMKNEGRRSDVVKKIGISSSKAKDQILAEAAISIKGSLESRKKFSLPRAISGNLQWAQTSSLVARFTRSSLLAPRSSIASSLGTTFRAPRQDGQTPRCSRCSRCSTRRCRVVPTPNVA